MKNKKFLLIISLIFFGFFFDLYSADYEENFQKRKSKLYKILTEKYYCAGSGNGFKPCSSRPPGFAGISSGDAFQYMGPIMGAIYETEGNQGTHNSDLANQKLRDELTSYGLFHFNFPGVTKLLMEFPNNPAVLDTKKQFLQKMFNRDDSYNAFTGEGTENHLFMSRLPAYVLCEMAVDSFPSQFPEASKWRDSLKNYIMSVSKRMYKAGLGEFNSSIYMGYTASGWLVLYDYAEDPEVKKAARAALDYLATEVAVHYVQGLNAGGDMRGKRVTSSLDLGSSMNWLGWVWYGQAPTDPVKLTSNFNKAGFAQSYYAASSDYRPPKNAVQLAQKELTLPAMYHNSKGKYLMDDPSYIKQTMYVDENYSLGATYYPYGGWSSAEWQTMSWKLVSRVDSGEGKSAQFASGLGMQYFSGGKYRAPFDQFAHHKNTLIQLTRVPSNASTIKNNLEPLFQQWANKWDSDFAKRFSGSDIKYSVNSDVGGITSESSGRHSPINFQDPDVSSGDSYIDIMDNGSTLNVDNNQSDDIFYAELEKTYIAIRSINSDNPDYDNGKLTDQTSSLGTLSGFVMEVRNKSDFSSFNEFKNDVRNNSSIDKSKVSSENRVIYNSTLGDKINVQYQTSGSFTEPIYDWGYGPEQRHVLQTQPPFTQPDWPSGEGHGKIASWSVNGEQVDLNQKWAVYEGPDARIKNDSIVLESNSIENYYVDYTGDVPEFSNTVVGNHKPVNDKGGNTSDEIKLYPNPADNYITISSNSLNLKGANASIIDVNGKEIKNKVLLRKSVAKIDITDLKSGVYTIKLSGKDFYRTKIIVVK